MMPPRKAGVTLPESYLPLDAAIAQCDTGWRFGWQEQQMTQVTQISGFRFPQTHWYPCFEYPKPQALPCQTSREWLILTWCPGWSRQRGGIVAVAGYHWQAKFRLYGLREGSFRMDHQWSKSASEAPWCLCGSHYQQHK